MHETYNPLNDSGQDFNDVNFMFLCIENARNL